MWAVRRACNPLKSQGFSIGFSRACCAKSLRAGYFEDNAVVMESLLCSGTSPSVQRYDGGFSPSPWFFMGKYSFSSQAGTKSGDEDDDLEDGFSELEALDNADDIVQDKNLDGKDDDNLISETEVDEKEDSDGDDEIAQNELELSETEMDVSDKRSRRKRYYSALFEAILAAPGTSVQSVLNKWVDEGNDLSHSEISNAILNLRKRRMYGRALQLSEWLESSKRLEFIEKDYASRVDLIAKLRGLQKAEHYIEEIPKSSRGKIIYGTFLANCVLNGNVKKAEEIFNKMRDLQFPVTSFACNQLLLLYKRTDRKKIADVLLLMEKENVKPSPFTYRLLIDAKGQSNDIVGMDEIIETMKAEGIEPDLFTKAILAKHYAFSGLKDKAEAVLKEMEKGDEKQDRWVCHKIIPIYSALGNVDEVERLWKVCESNPHPFECMAAIEAWGRLNKIDKAEEVFEKMLKIGKRIYSKHYSVLLKVYANHKMLSKGKDLVKRMENSGCRVGPLTWDAVVRLYVEAGEVEKADSILQRAAEQNQLKPMFNSYLTLIDQYSRRGDVANAEKMFYRMRQVGYVSRLRPFQSLIQAYMNAKAPAYGMRERMKADNVFPNKAVARQLAQVDAFRKNAATELLD